MNDEQKQPLLEAWFSDREVAPENAQEGVDRVMSEVPQTRQHGRWLPLPVHRPKATSTTPTTTDTTEYQPRPVPATNGRTPTAIGRTRIMLSPAKAITAGAIVFAVGGMMLVAQPFQQQGNVPGATIDPCTTPVAPATGVIRWGSEQPGTEVILSETGEHVRAFRYISTMEMEDDRLDGSETSVLEWDFSLNDGRPARLQPSGFDPARAGISRGTFRIDNADGSWEGPWTAAGESEYSWHGVVTLTGAEAYEGLSATLFLTSSREPAAPVVGSIYPTDIASCEFHAAE